MWSKNIIKGKNILIVDDEKDILDALEEHLEVGNLHRALTFRKAVDILDDQEFDLAILDIMGVRGYDLLEITVKKQIPTIMLTAHALSTDSFARSMETGADAFIPKDKLSDITFFAADSLRAVQESKKPKKWFNKLEPYFKKKFGTKWLSEVRGLYVE